MRFGIHSSTVNYAPTASKLWHSWSLKITASIYWLNDHKNVSSNLPTKIGRAAPLQPTGAWTTLLLLVDATHWVLGSVYSRPPLTFLLLYLQRRLCTCRHSSLVSRKHWFPVTDKLFSSGVTVVNKWETRPYSDAILWKSENQENCVSQHFDSVFFFI